jgi:hypothetical protein
MSDAQKLIAEVIGAHRSFYVHGIDHDSCTGCRWKGCGDAEHAEHVAAEIDKALGGLTPDIRYGGAYHRIGTEQIWREKHETRWVSGWSEVQP